MDFQPNDDFPIAGGAFDELVLRRCVHALPSRLSIEGPAAAFKGALGYPVAAAIGH
jgi:hypothetical protein